MARHDRSCVCISDLLRLVYLDGCTGRLKPPVAPGTPGYYVEDDNFHCVSSAHTKSHAFYSVANKPEECLPVVLFSAIYHIYMKMFAYLI